jgi:hypothetical protein
MLRKKAVQLIAHARWTPGGTVRCEQAHVNLELPYLHEVAFRLAVLLG